MRSLMWEPCILSTFRNPRNESISKSSPAKNQPLLDLSANVAQKTHEMSNLNLFIYFAYCFFYRKRRTTFFIETWLDSIHFFFWDREANDWGVKSSLFSTPVHNSLHVEHWRLKKECFRFRISHNLTHFWNLSHFFILVGQKEWRSRPSFFKHFEGDKSTFASLQIWKQLLELFQVRLAERTWFHSTILCRFFFA